MKANPNSIHAKLYRFTYTEKLPQNLCPYFWKLVVAAIIFIPNFLLQLPSLANSLLSKIQNRDCSDHRVYGLGIWVAILACSGYLFLVVHTILQLFGLAQFNDAIIAPAMGATFLILFVYYLYWKSNQPTKHEKRKPNIIVEFAKAKYNNYCPKIDWDDVITEQEI